MESVGLVENCTRVGDDENGDGLEPDPEVGQRQNERVQCGLNRNHEQRRQECVRGLVRHHAGQQEHTAHVRQ